MSRLRAADAAIQALDTSATYSRRRGFLLARGLREDVLDDTLAMLEAAMPVPKGEPPDGWLRFVETQRTGGYRESARNLRTLHVRRRVFGSDVVAAFAASAYFGVLFYDHAPWGPIVATLVPMALLVGRLKTTRWTLAPDRWSIPGRLPGRSTSLDPKTIEWVDVSRARLKDGVEVFGLELRAAGAKHVLVHPTLQLSEDSAHGLARVLEELAGLLPARLSTKVRVELADTPHEVEEPSAGKRTSRRDRER